MDAFIAGYALGLGLVFHMPALFPAAGTIERRSRLMLTASFHRVSVRTMPYNGAPADGYDSTRTYAVLWLLTVTEAMIPRGSNTLNSPITCGAIPDRLSCQTPVIPGMSTRSMTPRHGLKTI
jgi:hypothetical protein